MKETPRPKVSPHAEEPKAYIPVPLPNQLNGSLRGPPQALSKIPIGSFFYESDLKKVEKVRLNVEE
jgi:hypothetical protein